MSATVQRMKFGAIFNRARDILLKPKETWAIIAGENWGVMSLSTGYLLVIATAPVVCNLIMVLVHNNAANNIFFVAFALAFRNLCATLIAGFAAGWLAKQLEIDLDRDAALKLAAFSATAIFAMRVLNAFVSGFPLEYVGYAGFVYLAWLGAPILARNVRGDRVLPFACATALAFFIAMRLLSPAVATATGVPVTPGQIMQNGADFNQMMEDEYHAQDCMMGIGNGCGRSIIQ